MNRSGTALGRAGLRIPAIHPKARNGPDGRAVFLNELPKEVVDSSAADVSYRLAGSRVR